jgi:hypothetical protein
MVAVFGLGEPQHDHLVPSAKLVETNPVIDVFRLRRESLLIPGVEAEVQTGHGGCRLASLEPGKISIDGQPIRVSSHRSLPLPVFVSPVPACSRDCYRLHRVDGLWRCRFCSGPLTYSSRSRFRTIEGYSRAIYLRRRLHADLRLFTPIAPKPLRCRKYWLLALELREVESRIIGHLRDDVVGVLKRRDARRCRSRSDRS